MKILSRDALKLGGFAGIQEHRFVTDSRIFGKRKKAETFEGLGSFVYLADARYLPKGESGMHPHSEIDVISIIIDGRVSHEGSMEHGRDLVAGDVQVQRAGGEGFSHNEINPDDQPNRMLQLWALPEEAGRPAAYKFYQPATQGRTRIYGGTKDQSETFDSQTTIEVLRLSRGQEVVLENEHLSYVVSGRAEISEQSERETINEGDLVRSRDAVLVASEDLYLVVVTQQS